MIVCLTENVASMDTILNIDDDGGVHWYIEAEKKKGNTRAKWELRYGHRPDVFDHIQDCTSTKYIWDMLQHFLIHFCDFK